MKPHKQPWSADGLGKYVVEAFSGHWRFWFGSALVAIWMWLWLMEDMGFWLGGVLAFLIWFLLAISLAIPLLAALAALLSTLLLGLGLSPEERRAWAEEIRAQRPPPVAEENALSTPSPPTAPHACNWLAPLLIGWWIGSSYAQAYAACIVRLVLIPRSVKDVAAGRLRRHDVLHCAQGLAAKSPSMCEGRPGA
jgi:hypothetical protein